MSKHLDIPGAVQITTGSAFGPHVGIWNYLDGVVTIDLPHLDAVIAALTEARDHLTSTQPPCAGLTSEEAS